MRICCRLFVFRLFSALAVTQYRQYSWPAQVLRPYWYAWLLSNAFDPLPVGGSVLYLAVIFIYLFILFWVFSLLIVRLETLGFQSHEIQNFTPLFAIARHEYAEIFGLTLVVNTPMA